MQRLFEAPSILNRCTGFRYIWLGKSINRAVTELERGAESPPSWVILELTHCFSLALQAISLSEVEMRRRSKIKRELLAAAYFFLRAFALLSFLPFSLFTFPTTTPSPPGEALICAASAPLLRAGSYSSLVLLPCPEQRMGNPYGHCASKRCKLDRRTFPVVSRTKEYGTIVRTPPLKIGSKCAPCLGPFTARVGLRHEHLIAERCSSAQGE